MKVAIILILISVGAAQAAEAQHRSSTVRVSVSDAIRLKIERSVDPGVIVSDPACADGVPLPIIPEERSVWPGAIDIALPPTTAVCEQQEAKAKAKPKGKAVQVLTGRAEDVQGGQDLGSRITRTGESKVVALGTGNACSAINTVGQGC